MKKRIALALQGGGSHGSWTWGVLDRLLKEENLSIEAISGTSSGGMNAAALSYGMAIGGADGARDTLSALWEGVSKASPPWSAWMASMAAVVSPYSYPMYFNALAEVIEGVIEFAVVRACEKPKIFICATDVKTNKRKVFGPKEITIDVLLASACLPQIFRAVEIDGGAYWDGGYMGNPVLSPLLPHCTDVVIVQVNPMLRPEIPRTAREITDRVNEITFNSSLVHELMTINTINRLLEYGELVSARFHPVFFHRIAPAPAITGAKSDTSWKYLLTLHAAGWKAADDWLRDPNMFGKVGTASSVNVFNDLLAPLAVEYVGPDSKNKMNSGT